MFRAAYRSSAGALTVFATSGLQTHVVTGHSQVSDLTTFDVRTMPLLLLTSPRRFLLVNKICLQQHINFTQCHSAT